jgi:hypothetical protein
MRSCLLGFVVGALLSPRAFPGDACIGLFGEPTHELIGTTRTDADGRFSLGRIPHGKYRVVAQYGSFGTANAILILGWRGTNGILIRMQPHGINSTSYIAQSTQRSNSEPFRIGNVTKNFSKAGGCTITRSKNVWHSPPLFTSDLQNHASININGSDKILRLTKADEDTAKKEPVIGDRSRFYYAGGGVKVAVEYVITEVCAPSDESCEVTYYRAELAVSANHQTVNVTGYAVCGT